MKYFCERCATPLQLRVAEGDDQERPQCPACGFVRYENPAVLAITAIFAQDKILLARRGQQPHKGCWAPPGGYIEQGETAEQAAVREIHEEVGLALEPSCLLPFGVFSIPDINQIYVAFIARIQEPVELQPKLPETTEIAWFEKEAYPHDEMWEPSSMFDIPRVYDSIKHNRFDFIQRTDEYLRVVSHGFKMDVCWKKDES